MQLILHKPGKLYLARVGPAELMLDKLGYEFFGGFDKSGEPIWGSLVEKKPVFDDPSGVGWCMSASYNPFFKRVVIASQHDENVHGLLGFFDAPTPWGPWATIKYYYRQNHFGAQRPRSELEWKNNVFFAAFPTKWLEGDRFVLNFTGGGRGKDNDSFNTVEGFFIRP